MLSIYIHNFYLCIIETIFCGMGTTFGAITILGFLKGLDSDIVGGFASGTGFAGVFGSFYYEIMDFWKFNEYQSFFFFFDFWVFFYFISFLWILKLKKQFDSLKSEDLDYYLISLVEINNFEMEEVEINMKLNCENLPTIVKKNLY